MANVEQPLKQSLSKAEVVELWRNQHFRYWRLHNKLAMAGSVRWHVLLGVTVVAISLIASELSREPPANILDPAIPHSPAWIWIAVASIVGLAICVVNTRSIVRILTELVDCQILNARLEQDHCFLGRLYSLPQKRNSLALCRFASQSLCIVLLGIVASVTLSIALTTIDLWAALAMGVAIMTMVLLGAIRGHSLIISLLEKRGASLRPLS